MTVTADRTRAIHMLSDPTWDPGNYDYVSEFDADAPREFTGFDGYDAAMQAHTQAMLDLLAASPTSLFGQRWQCDHCGAHIRYVVVMLHKIGRAHV